MTCATLPIVVFTWGKRRFVRNTPFHVLLLLNFNLMPTWVHFAIRKSIQIHENIDSKRFPIMQPFSLRFGTPKTSLLGPNLEPSWLSRRPKRPPRPPPRGLPDRTPRQMIHPRGPQDGPRALKTPPRGPQDGPRALKTAQETSQTPPQRPSRRPKSPPRPNRQMIHRRADGQTDRQIVASSLSLLARWRERSSAAHWIIII